MLKEFYGPFFPPRRLILAYVIELGGKRVKVRVKVVDMPIYYNFLLGLNWIHAMMTIISRVFLVTRLHHQGNIVTNH